MLKELPEKFSVYIPTKEVSEMVQKKIFELGYEWAGCGKEIIVINNGNYPFFMSGGIFSEERNKIIIFRDIKDADKDYFLCYPEIPLSEILEREPKKKGGCDYCLGYWKALDDLNCLLLKTMTNKPECCKCTQQ